MRGKTPALLLAITESPQPWVLCLLGLRAAPSTRFLHPSPTRDAFPQPFNPQYPPGQRLYRCCGSTGLSPPRSLSPRTWAWGGPYRLLPAALGAGRAERVAFLLRGSGSGSWRRDPRRYRQYGGIGGRGEVWGAVRPRRALTAVSFRSGSGSAGTWTARTGSWPRSAPWPRSLSPRSLPGLCPLPPRRARC